MSGRALYNKPFNLWSKSERTKASFNSTFVLNIKDHTDPGGEGLAFIITGNVTLPESSYGEWLGIVNEGTNSSSQAQIVAIEFDTRKSYSEDINNNHVGLDINTIYSIEQVSLDSYGVNLTSGDNVTVNVQYDGENITVFVALTDQKGENVTNQVFSQPLDLSAYLPEKVYVGFSASTSNYTELNCVISWEFNGSDINDNPNLLWVWITVPILTIVLISSIAFGLYMIKSEREELEDAYPSIEDQIRMSSQAPRKFKLSELNKATGKFNSKNKLGSGGFGPVYKGCWRNKDIAVKKVSKKSTQGKQEFIAEVTTIGNLHHKNLVKLIGWCYESRVFLLVYEYMPKGSLDKYLFCNGKAGIEESALGWGKRLNIICGVARALDYLHNGCEKRVLHRDIKASNIMLDSDFNARLGDFGLARTIQSSEETHHSTREIAGTPGYMAPESFLIGRATVETDVYAFGVLVLEVACGKKTGNFIELSHYDSNIVYWVWEVYRLGNIVGAADPRLEGDFSQEEMECVLLLALACCHPNPHHRPSMKTVLQVLTGEAAAPLLPAVMPSFVWPAMPPSFMETNDITNEEKLPIFTELSGR
ncbi:Pkinase domain-containing protein/Lectin_legB domain-containing protein [Cephalotus follicularis]|uniref:Pkinase domain-containing protein/Lectin_legB domain-containing protein n=1 Tax=Cephalotus follicularis TaxID=3775 RepID=A0A1Q3B7E7_CEPFO|nr:Pkinase domain-containing protein/Lectin_legB domain-containing protein [Cephalotus follicularis]